MYLEQSGAWLTPSLMTGLLTTDTTAVEQGELMLGEQLGVVTGSPQH